MTKKIHHNNHDGQYPNTDTQHESHHGKTQQLGNHHAHDPLNQGGMHVADTHVKGKRLQRTWPKTNEGKSGRQKV